MCGRFIESSPVGLLAELLPELFPADELQTGFNIAPDESVSTVLPGAKLQNSRWGFSGNSLIINARSETILEKPTFKPHMQRGFRCLIPADGFYEWEKIDQSLRQPWFFHLKNKRPFFMAGIWREHRDQRETVIITTTANETVKPVHHRMPVMLTETDELRRWLAPDTTDALNLMRPLPAEQLDRYTVSSRVNNSRNKSASCMEHAAPVARTGELF